MEDKIAIYGKNIEVSDRINSYVTSKVGKVGRFLSDVDEVRVDLANMKNVRNAQDRYSAQITIRGKGYILRTEEKTDDLASAVDAASDKMMRQIERFKGKRSRNRGDGASVGETMAEPITVENENEPHVVRRKKFEVLPMSELEAIDQMQLSSHEDFFVFYNAETSAINILYKRNDGNYGVIIPEIA